MPITHIHKITKTLTRAIGYGSADKIEQDVVKDDIADAIKYGAGDKEGEVVFVTLNSWLNCESQGKDVAGDFKKLLDRFPRKRALREGENPALAYHLVQGFDGYVPPQLAHQIGEEFAREYLGNFAVQISTHTNTNNIHNHIIFCAVNYEGERYNDCDDTKDKMRKVSDRICEKHGLEILESTRDYRPVHWIDENGDQHSYEPTDRKNNLIAMRQEGKAAPDDVSSYRNSQSYQEWTVKKLTEKETVKNDIDTMLPMATSYEHLLVMLRDNLGYTVHDKKVNGEWLSHITFVPPNFVKGIRDGKISDDGYYVRENLEKVIENLNRNRTHEPVKESADQGQPAYFESYKYENIDLGRLDENRRAWKRADDTILTIERGEPERLVIHSAKQIEREIQNKLSESGLDESAAIYLAKHALDDEAFSKYQLSRTQSTYTRERAKAIQDRLNALHFLEEYNLTDLRKINGMVQNLWKQYQSSYDTLNEIGKKLNNARFIAGLPDNLAELRVRMENHAGDMDYMENEYAYDVSMEQKYLALMSRYHITSSGDAEKLRNNIDHWETQYRELSTKLQKMKAKLTDYENHVGIIRESSRGSREEYDTAWEEFDRIQSGGKETERKQEGERSRQSKSHRERDRS